MEGIIEWRRNAGFFYVCGTQSIVAVKKAITMIQYEEAEKVEGVSGPGTWKPRPKELENENRKVS
jgi:hypothetical protein